MTGRVAVCALALAAAMPVAADSLSLGLLVDGEGGRSIDLRGLYSPVAALTVGASVGHGTADLRGTGDFSGNSLGASLDAYAGAFFASAAADRWTDSGDLRSTVLHGELGLLARNGVAVAALVTRHDLRVHYELTVLGQMRERDIDFRGTGFGVDLSWFGEAWTTGARFLDYDYGRSVDRVQAVLDAASTRRFPRLQRLAGSVATRAAGAPAREAWLALGRQSARNSLTATLQWQRDALTGLESGGAGLTLGLEPTRHWGIDVSVGASRDKEAGTIAWAGLDLTLRSARRAP